MSSSLRLREGSPARSDGPPGGRAPISAELEQLVAQIETEVGSGGRQLLSQALIAFLVQSPPNHLDLHHCAGIRLDDITPLMADIIDAARRAGPHAVPQWRITWPHGMQEFPPWTIFLEDWVRHAAPSTPVLPYGLAQPEASFIDFSCDLRNGTLYSVASKACRNEASEYRRITCDAHLVVPKDNFGKALTVAQLLDGLEQHIADLPPATTAPCWRVGYACGEEGPHSSPVLLIRHNGETLVLVAETYQYFLSRPSDLAKHASRLGVPIYTVPTGSITGHGCRAQTIRYIAAATGKNEQGDYLVDIDTILADAKCVDTGVFTVGKLPFPLIRHAQSSAFISAHGPEDPTRTVHQRKIAGGERTDESWSDFVERTLEDNESHRGWLRRAGLRLGVDAIRFQIADQFSRLAAARWCTAMTKDFVLQLTTRMRTSRMVGSRPQGSDADLENFALDVVAIETGLGEYGLQGWDGFRERKNERGQTLLQEAVGNGGAAPVLLHHCVACLTDLSIDELALSLSLAARCRDLRSMDGILAIARTRPPAEAALILGLALLPAASPLLRAHTLGHAAGCGRIMGTMTACKLSPEVRAQLLLAGIQVERLMDRSMTSEWEGAIDQLSEDFPAGTDNVDFLALQDAFAPLRTPSFNG